MSHATLEVSPMHDTTGTLITGIAATLGLGGAVVAEVAQQPTITGGTLVLAVIGLASLWVRSHYRLQEERLHNEDLKAEVKYYRDRERERQSGRG
jgi:hypothetical protein